jgi:hypothetical protein
MNNPSGILAKRMDGIAFAGHEVKGVVIDESRPIALRDRPVVVQDLLAFTHPVAYLALSVTTESDTFRLLRSVQNAIDTTRVPRHAEGVISGEPIIEGAPDTLTNDSIDFGALVERFDQNDLLAQVVDNYSRAGATVVAYSQLYFRAPGTPVLGLYMPADDTFADYVSAIGQEVTDTVDIEVSMLAAVLALEFLAAAAN